MAEDREGIWYRKSTFVESNSSKKKGKKKKREKIERNVQEPKPWSIDDEVRYGRLGSPEGPLVGFVAGSMAKYIVSPCVREDVEAVKMKKMQEEEEEATLRYGKWAMRAALAPSQRERTRLALEKMGISTKQSNETSAEPERGIGELEPLHDGCVQNI